MLNAFLENLMLNHPSFKIQIWHRKCYSENASYILIVKLMSFYKKSFLLLLAHHINDFVVDQNDTLIKLPKVESFSKINILVVVNNDIGFKY